MKKDTIKDIAQIMNCSVGKVHYWLQRSIELKALLEKEYFVKSGRHYQRTVITDTECFLAILRTLDNTRKSASAKRKAEHRRGLNWTQTAIECWRQSGLCSGCDLWDRACSAIEGTPPMLLVVQRLLAEVGTPPTMTLEESSNEQQNK